MHRRPRVARKYCTLPLLLGLLLVPVAVSAAATTVYKWVDERGQVNFSDSPPTASVTAETLQFASHTAPPDAEVAARLERMRRTTELMAADRREREAARAEKRSRQNARADSWQAPPESYTYLRGQGQRYYPGWRPPFPVKPPYYPSAGAQNSRLPYPSSYIRARYKGAAAKIFNPGVHRPTYVSGGRQTAVSHRSAIRAGH